MLTHSNKYLVINLRRLNELCCVLSLVEQVEQDEDSGLQTAVISLGAGVKKRVTLNTHGVQQKNQVSVRVIEDSPASSPEYSFSETVNGYICVC